MCDRGTGAVRSGAQEVSGSVLRLPSVSASWIAGGAILPSQAPTGVALGQSLLSSPYLLDLLGRSAHTLQSPKYDLEGSCPSPPVRYGAPHKVTCRLPEFIESRGTETGAQRGEVERPGGLTVLAGARKITAIGVAMLRVGPGLPEINDNLVQRASRALARAGSGVLRPRAFGHSVIACSSRDPVIYGDACAWIDNREHDAHVCLVKRAYHHDGSS
jgi:hypothetical protein